MEDMHRRAFAVASTLAALATLAGAEQAGAQSGRARPDRPAPATRASRVAHAHTGSALKAHDTAKLHYVSASGSTLYEVGNASGTLPGGMHVHMRLSVRFTGSFVIYARGGSIMGHGSATPHGSGVYESFAGTLSVRGGTGRFRRAHGTARLYGVFDRKNYSLTIQTVGTLYY